MYEEEAKHNIEWVCHEIGIDSTTAQTIFQTIYNEKFKYRWGTKKAAVGCVTVAIRSEGLPYEIGEIGEVFNINRNEVYKVYKGIKELAPVEQQLPTPVNFVYRIHDEGVGTEDTVELAKVILSEGEEVCKSRSPVVMGASAMYLAVRMLDQEWTQEEIAKKANVTVQSIRARHSELSESIDEGTVSENIGK